MTAAGWRNKDATERIGGIPTTMIDALQLSKKEDHTAEKILMESVIDGFFVGSTIEQTHLNIFFCSLMCRWQFFIVDCELVSSSDSQHVIVTMVKRILRVKKVDYNLFLKWCKSSSVQFRTKNMHALAYENISDIPHDTQCDARTILQMENRHKQAVNLLSTKLTTVSAELTTVTAELTTIKNDVSEILRLVKQSNPPNPVSMLYSTLLESNEMIDTEPISVAPHDLTLNPSFKDWFVNDAIRQKKNTIEIFIHWNKYRLLQGHENDKGNKTKHTSFGKYSKLYKTMISILLPTKIDSYPHDDISNQIAWENKYATLLSEKFIQLELIGKSKKRAATINVLETYATQFKKK